MLHRNDDPSTTFVVATPLFIFMMTIARLSPIHKRLLFVNHFFRHASIDDEVVAVHEVIF